MSRPVALAILVVGVLLLAAGIRSSKSASSQLSEIFTDRPTRETSVLFAAGVGGIVAGAWGLFKRGN